MYEFEELTNSAETVAESNGCSPFYGECYPVAEDCCGPDCDPNDGYCEPDVKESCRPDEEE